MSPELDTDLSSAAIDESVQQQSPVGQTNESPTSTLVKREETTTTRPIIRPTYVPPTPTTTARVITNPLLDPNFKPISRATHPDNKEEEPNIQKSSVFPARGRAVVGNSPLNSGLMFICFLAVLV